MCHSCFRGYFDLDFDLAADPRELDRWFEWRRLENGYIGTGFENASLADISTWAVPPNGAAVS